MAYYSKTYPCASPNSRQRSPDSTITVYLRYLDIRLNEDTILPAHSISSIRRQDTSISIHILLPPLLTLHSPDCKAYQAMSMHPSQPTSISHRLDWSHVGFGLAFVAFNSVISQLLQLRIGASLAIAALRCITQLTVMGAVLQHVLVMKNLWAVAGIACTFSSARCTIVACVTVLTFPSYCSASELYQHHRSWCVLV